MNLKHTLLASGAFGGMTRNEQRLGRFIRDGEGHPAAAPAAAPVVEEPAVDPFDAAFAEHAAAPEAGGAPPAPAAPAAGDPPAPAAPAAGDPPAPAAGDPPAPAAGEAPAAPAAPAAGDPPAPAAPAAPEAPKLDADEVLNRLAGMIQKPGEAAPAAAAPEPEAPIYTAEEQAILTEYEKNWPDVAKAETLRRRAEYADIFKFVFTEVANYVQPLKDQLATVGNSLHIGELKAAVPDYSETLEADVAAWVDNEPAYLQGPYKQVMKTGTSEEVADLIGRYRAAKGIAPAPAVVPPAPAAGAPPAPAVPAAAPKTELSSAAKQAAESLAPVSGDRSAVPQGEDPQDFDTAFSKYAAAGG